MSALKSSLEASPEDDELIEYFHSQVEERCDDTLHGDVSTGGLSSQLYSRIYRSLTDTRNRFPLLILAIPKYKRSGALNRRWRGGFLRVHSALHCDKPPTVGRAWPPVSGDFRRASKEPKQLCVLREGVMWETFVDIAMSHLGDDHHNGDRIFACALPKIPAIDSVVRSLEMWLNHDDVSQEERELRMGEAKGFLRNAHLDRCVFTTRFAPYEATNSTNRTSATSDGPVSMFLSNGSKYDGQIARAMWDAIPREADVDLPACGFYQVQWPADRATSGHRFFTLRDGCLEDGSCLLSVGVVIRMNRLRAWGESEPFIKYFDEAAGVWTEKDFTEENSPTTGSSSYVVSVLNVRRVMFVVGNRRDPSMWIRKEDGTDFHVPFAGVYQVFGSGHLVQICVRSAQPKLNYPSADQELPTRTVDASVQRREEVLRSSLEVGVDFFSLVDGSDGSVDTTVWSSHGGGGSEDGDSSLSTDEMQRHHEDAKKTYRHHRVSLSANDEEVDTITSLV
eukprot:GHVH01003776.1.p1 GENE.GHVH01003776.1~~GHVH01003776.1.p1  ORF type:complete len:559 (-),score=83.01 GHVH01003776.1:29-1549(-)